MAGKSNGKRKAHKKVCEAYRARGQREKNKKIRLNRHIKRFPKDLVAVRALGTAAVKQTVAKGV